jgi:hypothetical protein
MAAARRGGLASIGSQRAPERAGRTKTRRPRDLHRSRGLPVFASKSRGAASHPSRGPGTCAVAVGKRPGPPPQVATVSAEVFRGRVIHGGPQVRARLGRAARWSSSRPARWSPVGISASSGKSGPHRRVAEKRRTGPERGGPGRRKKCGCPTGQPVGCHQASRSWLSILHTRSPPFVKASPVSRESSLERERAPVRRATVARPACQPSGVGRTG